MIDRELYIPKDWFTDRDPILAGVRSPRLGRKPNTWTRIDRDYETLRINMQTLFHDLGITTTRTAAA